MVTDVPLLVLNAQAPGSRPEGLYSSSSHHPQTQEATHVAGEGRRDSGLRVIVPSDCPLTRMQPNMRPARARSCEQSGHIAQVHT